MLTIAADSTNKGDIFHYRDFYDVVREKGKPFHPGKMRVHIDEKSGKRVFGTQPMVVEPIEMMLKLKTKYPQSMLVYPLSPKGTRRYPVDSLGLTPVVLCQLLIDITRDARRISFKADGGRCKTIYYEIAAGNL